MRWWTSWRNGNMEFCHGFVRALQLAFDVQVVSNLQDVVVLEEHNNNNNNNTVVKMMVVRKGDTTAFGGYAYRMGDAPRDARELRQGLLPSDTAVSLFECCATRPPRVGILNRAPRHGRALHNADALARHLQRTLASSTTTTTTNGAHLPTNNRAGIIDAIIPVVTFQGASFEDQIAFFASIDILISPHGAQLTGLPFLPPPCSALLEIFPDRYYYQQFFGSLAEAAGVRQYTLYMGGVAAENETTTAAHVFDRDIVHGPRSHRRTAKRANLCPPLDAIHDAVRTMAEDWWACCARSPTTTSKQQQQK